MGWPFPLLAKHILYINLATDGSPAIALSMERSEPDIMQRKPRNPNETIFFGVKKIPELAKSFGKATSEFEKAKIEAKRDLDKYKNENTNIEREKLESIATTLRIDYTDKNDEDLKKAIENEINKNKNI